MFWLIGLALLLALFGAFLVSVLRWLGRLFVSLAVAIPLAVAASILLTDDVGEVATLSVLLTLAITVPIFWLMRPRALVTKAPLVAPPLTRTAQSKPRRFGIFRPASPIEFAARAWDRLEQEASDQPARVAVARRSCERFKSKFKGKTLDVGVQETLIILDNRIPQLIDQELTRANGLAGAAHSRLIDDLVDLLERFAAECERQLSDDRKSGGYDQILRQHIENYLAREQLRPFG